MVNNINNINIIRVNRKSAKSVLPVKQIEYNLTVTYNNKGNMLYLLNITFNNYYKCRIVIYQLFV